MLNFNLENLRNMDPKIKTVLIGVAVLFVLGAILGSIFYLGKVSKNNGTDQERTALDSLSRLRANTNTTPSTDSGNPLTSGDQLSNLKVYPGEGFAVRYPSSWGILTCSNSQNIELDPTTGQELKGILCDRAVKPVTVLVVDKLNCQGETVTLGGYRVLRSKTTVQDGTNYRWCLTVGGKNLDITHRVSASGSRATSKDDFSAKVEELISNIQLSQGS